jgi:hypothetical protein
VGGSPVNLADPLGLAPGDYPPPPKGYDPNTWKTGKWSNGKWVLTDPEGNKWTIHAEDEGHWRHWDKRDPNGKDQGQQPPNSGKPRSNQKKIDPKKQCSEDPNGNTPPWEAPKFSFPPLPLLPGLPFPKLPPFPELPPFPKLPSFPDLFPGSPSF